MNYNNKVDPNIANYYLKYLKNNNLYSKETYQQGIKQLQEGKPIQYIIGNVDFYGNIINVNENVLIPRFETELLVEKTIKYINQHFKNKKLNIIDLGTGSGCIAIALKKILTSLEVDALDISKEAIELAKKNAHQNKVSINFIEGNMEDPLSKKYDVIISNPPYIDYGEEIMDIVKNNEPHIALYAKEKGIYYYHKIIKNLKNNLPNNYLIAFEIGHTQAKKIEELAIKYLDNPKIIIEKDYSGKDRFIFIINN